MAKKELERSEKKERFQDTIGREERDYYVLKGTIDSVFVWVFEISLFEINDLQFQRLFLK